ncbi:MAG: hypothetical protein IJA61_02400 [Clostridia bacterium]|nr:hypothetical protein [Clostridia bacterium]
MDRKFKKLAKAENKPEKKEKKPRSIKWGKVILIVFISLVVLMAAGTGIYALAGGFNEVVIGMTNIYFDINDVTSTSQTILIEDDHTLVIHYLPENATDIKLNASVTMGNSVIVDPVITAGQEFTIKVAKDANGRNIGGSAEIEFTSADDGSLSNLVTTCTLRVIVDVPVNHDDLVFKSDLQYIPSSTLANTYIISKNMESTTFYLESEKSNIFETNIFNSDNQRDVYFYYQLEGENRPEVPIVLGQTNILAPVTAVFNEELLKYELTFCPGEILENSIKIIAKTHRSVTIQDEYYAKGFDKLESEYLGKDIDELNADQEFLNLKKEFEDFLVKYESYFIQDNAEAINFFNGLKSTGTLFITVNSEFDSKVRQALSYVFVSEYVNFYISDVKVDSFRVTDEERDFNITSSDRQEQYIVYSDSNTFSLMDKFEIDLAATSLTGGSSQEIQSAAIKELMMNNLDIKVLLFDKSGRSEVSDVALNANSNNFIDNTQINFDNVSWQNDFIEFLSDDDDPYPDLQSMITGIQEHISEGNYYYFDKEENVYKRLEGQEASTKSSSVDSILDYLLFINQYAINENGDRLFGTSNQYLTVEKNVDKDGNWVEGHEGEWIFNKLIPSKSDDFQIYLMFELKVNDEDGNKVFYDFAKVNVMETSGTATDGVERNEILSYEPTMFVDSNNSEVEAAYNSKVPIGTVFGKQNITFKSDVVVNPESIAYNSFKLFAFVGYEAAAADGKIDLVYDERSIMTKSLMSNTAGYEDTTSAYYYRALNTGRTDVLYRFENLNQEPFQMVVEYEDDTKKKVISTRYDFENTPDSSVIPDNRTYGAIYAFEITNENWEIIAEYATTNEIVIFGCYVLTDIDNNPVNREGKRIYTDELVEIDDNTTNYYKVVEGMYQTTEDVLENYDEDEKYRLDDYNIVTYTTLHEINLNTNAITTEIILENINFYSKFTEPLFVEGFESEYGTPLYSKIPDTDNYKFAGTLFDNGDLIKRNTTTLNTEQSLYTLKLIVDNTYRNIIYASPFEANSVERYLELRGKKAEDITPEEILERNELERELSNLLFAWKYAFNFDTNNSDNQLNFIIGYLDKDGNFIEEDEYAIASSTKDTYLQDFLNNNILKIEKENTAKEIMGNDNPLMFALPITVQTHKTNSLETDNKRNLKLNISEAFKSAFLYAPTGDVELVVNDIKVNDVNAIYNDKYSIYANETDAAGTIQYANRLSMTAQAEGDAWEIKWDDFVYDKIYHMLRIFTINEVDKLLDTDTITNDIKSNIVHELKFGYSVEDLYGEDKKPWTGTKTAASVSISGDIPYEGILDVITANNVSANKYLLLYLFDLDGYDTVKKSEDLITLYNIVNNATLNLSSKYEDNIKALYKELVDNSDPDLKTDYDRLITYLNIISKLYIKVQEYNENVIAKESGYEDKTIEIFDIYNFANFKYTTDIKGPNTNKISYVDVYGVYQSRDLYNLIEAMARQSDKFRNEYFAAGGIFNEKIPTANPDIFLTYNIPNKPDLVGDNYVHYYTLAVYIYNKISNTNHLTYRDIPEAPTVFDIFGGGRYEKYIFQFLIENYFSHHDVFEFYNDNIVCVQPGSGDPVWNKYAPGCKSITDYMREFKVKEFTISPTEFYKYFDGYTADNSILKDDVLKVALTHDGFLPISSTIDKIIVDYKMSLSFGDFTITDTTNQNTVIDFHMEAVAEYSQPYFYDVKTATHTKLADGATVKNVIDENYANVKTLDSVNVRCVNLLKLIQAGYTDASLSLSEGITFEITEGDGLAVFVRTKGGVLEQLTNIKGYTSGSASDSSGVVDLYIFDSFIAGTSTIKITATIGKRIAYIELVVSPNLTLVNNMTVDNQKALFVSASTEDEKIYDLSNYFSISGKEDDITPTFYLKSVQAQGWNGEYSNIGTINEEGTELEIVGNNKIIIDGQKLIITGKYFTEMIITIDIESISGILLAGGQSDSQIDDLVIHVYPEKKILLNSTYYRELSNTNSAYKITSFNSSIRPFESGDDLYGSVFTFLELDPNCHEEKTINGKSIAYLKSGNPTYNNCETNPIDDDVSIKVNTEESNLQGINWYTGDEAYEYSLSDDEKLSIYDQYYKTDGNMVDQPTELNTFVSSGVSIIEGTTKLDVIPYNRSFILPLSISIADSYMIAGNKLNVFIPVAGYNIITTSNGTDTPADYKTESNEFDMPTVYITAGAMHTFTDFIHFEYADGTLDYFKTFTNNFSELTSLEVLGKLKTDSMISDGSGCRINPLIPDYNLGIDASDTSPLIGFEVNRLVYKGVDEKISVDFIITEFTPAGRGTDAKIPLSNLSVKVVITPSDKIDLGEHFVIIKNECFDALGVDVKNGTDVKTFAGDLNSYFVVGKVLNNLWNTATFDGNELEFDEVDSETNKIIYRIGESGIYKMSIEFYRDGTNDAINCVSQNLQKVVFNTEIIQNDKDNIRAKIVFHTTTSSIALGDTMKIVISDFVPDILFDFDSVIEVENGTTIDWFLKYKLFIKDNYDPDLVNVYFNTIDNVSVITYGSESDLTTITFNKLCTTVNGSTGQNVFIFNNFDDPITYTVKINIGGDDFEIKPINDAGGETDLKIIPKVPSSREDITSITVENLSYVSDLFRYFFHTDFVPTDAADENGNKEKLSVEFSVSDDKKIFTYGNETLTLNGDVELNPVKDEAGNTIDYMLVFKSSNNVTADYKVYGYSIPDLTFDEEPFINKTITIIPHVTLKSDVLNGASEYSGMKLQTFVENYFNNSVSYEIIDSTTLSINNGDTTTATVSFTNVEIVKNKDTYILLMNNDAKFTTEVVNSVVDFSKPFGWFGLITPISVTPTITNSIVYKDDADPKVLLSLENGVSVSTFIRYLNGLGDNPPIVKVEDNKYTITQGDLVYTLEFNGVTFIGDTNSFTFQPDVTHSVSISLTKTDGDSIIEIIKDIYVALSPVNTLSNDVLNLSESQLQLVENGISVTDFVKMWVSDTIIRGYTPVDTEGDNVIKYSKTGHNTITFILNGASIKNNRIIFISEADGHNVTIKITGDYYGDVEKVINLTPKYTVDMNNAITIENGQKLDALIEALMVEGYQEGYNIVSGTDTTTITKSVEGDRTITIELTNIGLIGTNNIIALGDNVEIKVVVVHNSGETFTLTFKESESEITTHILIKTDAVKLLLNTPPDHTSHTTIENGSSLNYLLAKFFDIKIETLDEKYNKNVDPSTKTITLTSSGTDGYVLVVTFSNNITLTSYNILFNETEPGTDYTITVVIKKGDLDLVDLKFTVTPNMIISNSVFDATALTMHNAMSMVEFLNSLGLPEIGDGKYTHSNIETNGTRELKLSKDGCPTITLKFTNIKIVSDAKSKYNLITTADSDYKVTIVITDVDNTDVDNKEIISIEKDIAVTTILQSSIYTNTITINNASPLSDFLNAYFNDVSTTNEPANYTITGDNEIEITNTINGVVVTTTLTFTNATISNDLRILFTESATDRSVGINIAIGGVNVVSTTVKLTPNIIINSSVLVANPSIENGIYLDEFAKIFINSSKYDRTKTTPIISEKKIVLKDFAGNIVATLTLTDDDATIIEYDSKNIITFSDDTSSIKIVAGGVTINSISINCIMTINNFTTTEKQIEDGTCIIDVLLGNFATINRAVYEADPIIENNTSPNYIKYTASGTKTLTISFETATIEYVDGIPVIRFKIENGSYTESDITIKITENTIPLVSYSATLKPITIVAPAAYNTPVVENRVNIDNFLRGYIPDLGDYTRSEPVVAAAADSESYNTTVEYKHNTDSKILVVSGLEFDGNYVVFNGKTDYNVTVKYYEGTESSETKLLAATKFKIEANYTIKADNSWKNIYPGMTLTSLLNELNIDADSYDIPTLTTGDSEITLTSKTNSKESITLTLVGFVVNVEETTTIELKTTAVLPVTCKVNDASSDPVDITIKEGMAIRDFLAEFDGFGLGGFNVDNYTITCDSDTNEITLTENVETNPNTITLSWEGIAEVIAGDTSSLHIIDYDRTINVAYKVSGNVDSKATYTPLRDGMKLEDFIKERLNYEYNNIYVYESEPNKITISYIVDDGAQSAINITFVGVTVSQITEDEDNEVYILNFGDSDTYSITATFYDSKQNEISITKTLTLSN